MSTNLTNRVFRGLVSGAVASVAMSAFFRAAQSLGGLDRPPPRRIIDAAFSRLRRRHTSRLTRAVTATAAHLAFGMGCGVMYQLGTIMLPGPARRAPVVSGATFGAAVWAASYAGWVPALRILPPPQHDDPRRVATMVLAHLVYGGVLGKLGKTEHSSTSELPASRVVVDSSNECAKH